MYPGLIGWVIINLGMAHKQYLELGYVTNSMILVNAFQVRSWAEAGWGRCACMYVRLCVCVYVHLCVPVSVCMCVSWQTMASAAQGSSYLTCTS